MRLPRFLEFQDEILYASMFRDLELLKVVTLLFASNFTAINSSNS